MCVSILDSHIVCISSCVNVCFHAGFPQCLCVSMLDSHTACISSWGPSIKYVTLFFANFDPPPPVTLCHTSRDPPKVRHTSRTPPIFCRPSTKIPDKSPLYKFFLNCSRRFLSGGLVRVGFVRSPFCHNTYVTTES